MKKVNLIFVFSILSSINIIVFSQELPDKIVYKYWENFNSPQRITITKINTLQLVEFKYSYDTIEFNNLQNSLFLDIIKREYTYPFYITFQIPFDTIQCNCRILDNYSIKIFEKGENKMIPRNADLYVMETDKRDIIQVIVIDYISQSILRRNIKYSYTQIKITDLLPLKMGYQIYFNDRIDKISFISNNYYFKDLLLNHYYILCN